MNSQAVAYPIKKGLKVLCLNGVRDKDFSSVHRCSIVHSCFVITYMLFYLHQYVLRYASCRMPTNPSCVTIIIIIIIIIVIINIIIIIIIIITCHYGRLSWRHDLCQLR